MLKIKVKVRTFLIFLLIAGIIGLGMVGASWNVGFAETNPTIPIVYGTYEPKEICVNSDDTQATIFGENFINYLGDYYTWVKWLGPNDVLPTYIIPDYINEEETILKFTIDAEKLTQVGWASFWIVNHPELEEPFEIMGAFWIEIKSCNNIYLPLVVK
jgi:hypothetical protein